MFAYNTRTELVNGTRFIEKDIILFDYVYTSDLLFQVEAVLVTPGFGFVIREEDAEGEQAADNAVLITFSSDNSYRVIVKNGIDQTTVVNQFVESVTNLYDPNGVTLFFKKHKETLEVCRAVYTGDGVYKEIRLLEYKMQYDMPQYKIGIYSNAGNTVTFASIRTEAPSNWISNVFNAGGGRIHWIRNGFTIDEAEYDVEVEAEDIHLKAGTYWFDYKTDNPDMKAYVYPTYRKNTAEKRARAEILDTMVDEEKNILEDDGHFTLPTDHAINIKFKGKWGTVTEICVKSNKEDGFIETGYGSTIRPGSRIVFDLDKVAEINMKGTILNVPIQDPGELRTYHIFRRGEESTGLLYPVELNKQLTYHFTTSTNQVTVNGEPFFTFTDTSDNRLIAFENVTAIFDEIMITLITGETVNVLIQKTLKTTVSKNIASPIFVLDEDGEPFDLSASYRILTEPEPVIEVFNALNPIHLSWLPFLSNMDFKLYGIPANSGHINKEATTIEDLVGRYTEISYAPDIKNLLKKQVSIPLSMREPYKYIAVAYNTVKTGRYIFTNWEREVFDLAETQRVNLNSAPENTTDGIIVYGIEDPDYYCPDLIYHIENQYDETSINLCAYLYDMISQQQYSVNQMNRLIPDPDILQKYRYLIVDYLKKDSYAINERTSYYEVDVSSSDMKFHLLYDSSDGVTTQTYRILTTEQMTRKTPDYAIQQDDFVILEATDVEATDETVSE